MNSDYVKVPPKRFYLNGYTIGFHFIYSDVRTTYYTRCCGSVYLGVNALGVCEVFFCVLGMCELCGSFVYFRGWLRCVKWKAWSYIGRGLVR